MRNNTILATVACGLLLSGCTNTDDPQLAMCQAVTKQLLGNTISNWDEINQDDKSRLRNIDITFTQSDGSARQINCGFPIKENGDVDTAPATVSLDGEKIATKEILQAGLKASGELLKGTAANTVAKSKELASEAKVIAADAAVKARENAADATKIASEAAGKAKESVSKIAGEVSETARVKALEAAEMLQKKLEN